MLLQSPIEGQIFKMADVWFWNIPYKRNTPIKYLEIGAYLGINAISVSISYAKHPDSEIYIVDPWVVYDEYDEYKDGLDSVYKTFLRNIEATKQSNKFKIHRGYSNEVVPKLEDNFFDMIYIDGNHSPEYVLEDAVLAFRKLKVGGYMIFDDRNWPDGPDYTQRGIDAFLLAYRDRIKDLGFNTWQQFIQKLA